MENKVRNCVLKKLKQNRAFSFMETLTVVIILLILLGISMPQIGKWKTKLDMVELDNHAKTIYLEAQQQLITKKTEGSLVELHKIMMDDYSGNVLNEAPHDFDEELKNKDKHKMLYHLGKQEGAMSRIIPQVSNAYQMGGNYLIEFNPESGEVYSAFYWEKEESIDYNTDVVRLVGRDVLSRTPSKIGYYGGYLDSISEKTLTLTQNVELVNSEELYLKISYNLSSILLNNISALKIECEISDESGEEPYRVNIPTGKYEQSSTLDFYFLLDSMQDGLDFETITGLHPGDNLSITVKGTFENAGHYSTDTDTVTGNSLFAGKIGDTLQISAVRHLRNLDHANFDASSIRKVVQIGDVDFEAANYAWNGNAYVGKENGTRPIAFLSPIKKEELLLNDDSANKTVIDGNTYTLKNLVIQGDGIDNVGVFAQTLYTDFHNLKVEDVKVSGANNVGGLVGKASLGNITDCGVYLTTYKIQDGGKAYFYDNIYTTGAYRSEMEERYATRIISGHTNVGGLIGVGDNLNITGSFAAIMVKGNSVAGGFAGNIADSKIEEGYASGDVYGSRTLGGFFGNAKNTEVTNVYTTSDLYGKDSRIGGFAGKIEGGNYNTCYSYGEVLNGDGTDVPNDSGTFVAAAGGATYFNCAYLKQEGYNSASSLERNMSGVSAKGYEAFAAEAGSGIDMNSSFPYDDALRNNLFPFVLRTGSHYGNWPTKYTIDTSLVYYERYADGTYGYYCETRLISREGEDTPLQTYVWVLDSLKEMECVEDGYALLSVYNLSKFSYALHIGSDANYSQPAYSAANYPKEGTLRVVNDYGTDSQNEAVRLRQQSALEFKAYTEEKEEYRGQPWVDTFSVSGMYLYQLPYHLQCTFRIRVDNFYDRFIVYNGYVKGNDTVPMIGGSTPAEGETFFYCPHFAKTAVNPGMRGTDGANQNLKLSNPPKVYVRSARQLNALGTYKYYWNSLDSEGGYVDRIYFKQEADINFGTYTKTYCGQEFDMGIGGNVRNASIGVPGVEGSGQQFRNSYDGQGYKIIDYCVENATQFTGLFGEAREAELKNIVMTVSAPGKGRIVSKFGNWYRIGIGALVGLAYGNANVIENCTAVGYSLEYDTVYNVRAIVMGGLIGVAMSDVTNCSAENDIKLVVSNQYNGNIYLGGLVGSHFYSDLKNGYAGGTIDIINENFNGLKTSGSTVAVAGICPGYYQFPKTSDVSSTMTFESTYENLYSYTEILAEEKDYDYVMGCVGNCVTENSAVNSANPMIFKNCYYLDFVYTGMNLSADKEKGSGLTKRQLEKLTDVEGLENRVSQEYGNPGAYTYPVDDRLKGHNYPYPAVITHSTPEYLGNVESYYVHYGDWPVGALYKKLPVYYEKYEDNTYGIYTFYPNGEVFDTLYKNDQLRIVDTGYGLMSLVKENGKTQEGTYNLDGGTYYIYNDELVSNTENYANQAITFDYELVRVYSNGQMDIMKTEPTEIYVNNQFAVAISMDATLGVTKDKPLQVRTMDQLMQIEKLRQKNNEKIYIKQTYSIYLDNSYSTKNFRPVSLNAGCDYNGGSAEGYTILQASQNVFEDNAGDISNCVVMEPVIKIINEITSDTVAIGLQGSPVGFVKTNTGSISNCMIWQPEITSKTMVKDSVTEAYLTGKKMTIPGAVGFVKTNNGIINECQVVNAKIGAEVIFENSITPAIVEKFEGLSAVAGFAETNWVGGIIRKSGVYATQSYDGTVITGNRAYGFVESNDGGIESCFVAGTVNGNQIVNENAVTPVMVPGMAGGFANKNTGNIILSYANTISYADGSGSEAAGFLFKSNTTFDTLMKCYTAGTVTADGITGVAYGFGKELAASKCYTVSEIQAKNMHGFVQNSTDIRECYWAYDEFSDYNTAALESESLGTRVNLMLLRKDDVGDVDLDYATDNGPDAPYNRLLPDTYPYPSVGMVHFGDWPILRNAYVDNALKDSMLNYSGIFYYEKYAAGSYAAEETYGIYGVGQPDGGTENTETTAVPNLINTLAETRMHIMETGCGIICKSGGSWSVKETEAQEYQLLDSYLSQKSKIDNLQPVALGMVPGYEFYVIQSYPITTAPAPAYTTYFKYSNDINGPGVKTTATISIPEVESRRMIGDGQ